MACQAAAGGGEDCTRYYDTVRGTVLETCTPTKPPPQIAPGAKPLSVTAPELRFPSGVIPAVVEKIVDPVTLELRYEYSTRTVTVADLRLPPKGTPEYRLALALTKAVAPSSSVLYLEKKEYNSGGWKRLYTLWQLNNQLGLLLVEQGLAEYVPNAENDYDDVLTNAMNFAKENKLGIWKGK